MPQVLSSMRPHQRWASAPPVQERHSCAELADDSCSAGQHAASAPPEDRPPRAPAAGASFGSNAYYGVGANSGDGARLGAGLSMPELMGVSPLFPDRILSRGQAGCAVLRPEQASFVISPSPSLSLTATSRCILMLHAKCYVALELPLCTNSSRFCLGTRLLGAWVGSL